MSSEKKQQGADVNYHKRLAMGEKLDGSILGSKGTTNPISKPAGGLSHVKKK
jgi:hypothetical protein